jgi:hypothetical protein
MKLLQDQRWFIKIGTLPTEMYELLQAVCVCVCVCVRERERERESQQNFTLVPKVSCRSRQYWRRQSKLNHMAVMAYDCVGIIATDSVPFGSSVAGDYYANFLRRKLRPTAAVGSWCVDNPWQYKTSYRAKHGDCFHQIRAGSTASPLIWVLLLSASSQSWKKQCM